ncbi:LysR family transcriptional regulator, partial [Nonomuraea candida]|uniref:LysR family transcriptional regulator n=1 Tax=Nonomuraea candida TaxID=359159 RepID=UPI001FDFB9D9
MPHRAAPRRAAPSASKPFRTPRRDVEKKGVPQVELRDIEIFLTLAEELHFGRTAQRLHVTQARVSQTIKKQERRIGAALFDRDNRNVALTPIGRQLYEDLRPMYRGLREGIERAVRAAQGTTGVLRLGMVGHNPQDLRPLFDAFRARHPGCDLQ